MKNSRLKLLVAIIVFCILVMMPIFANAENDDLAIVKTNEKEYLIYMSEFMDNNFKFALSDKKDTLEENLNFINSELDKDSESPKNVAYITNKTYSENTIYMWVKDFSGKITGPQEIVLTKGISREDLTEVENITKKISVDAKQRHTYPEQVINGYKVSTETGKIVITDEADATYYYEQTPIANNAEYAELMRLAELIESNFENMTIIQKINTEKEFYEKYNTLISKAKWSKVENMEVLQPLEANDGDKYVVFLKKVNTDGTEILDAQFMTCLREDNEKGIDAHTEKHDKVVEETAKLPITYDSIILFVILGVIVLAIIFVIIRKKNIKNNAKH